MEIGGIFKNIENKKEREIYVWVYAVICLAVITILIGAANGYFSAYNCLGIVASKGNSGVVTTISEKAQDLHDMQARLRIIKDNFEKIKYPNRLALRGDINKDLSDIDFIVQTFTLKDFNPANADIQNPNETDSSSIPQMVEIIISGKLPTQNLIEFLHLTDRADRFWYVNTIEITPPDGAAEFFSKSYLALSPIKKKEMFELYEDSLNYPYITVTFSFYTFVKGSSETPASEVPAAAVNSNVQPSAAPAQ